MVDELRKRAGAYYTPEATVASLVRWAARRKSDRLLDPACGDGRFLAMHRNSVGVEQDSGAARAATARAPWALVHEGDFFRWAAQTAERFDCAAGNPPFIRYQRFTGAVREGALNLCASLGAHFSGLTSSWAPFLVVASSLLRPGGRLAFVVPAEIGHAPYAAPLIEHLAGHFATVRITAVREKLFPELSEDCWLLYCSGYTDRSQAIEVVTVDRYVPRPEPPTDGELVTLEDWRSWNRRFRPVLMPKPARDLYRHVADSADTVRLGRVAKVGIGYVTGANDFFHMRPSQAAEHGIPDEFLWPSVRTGRQLSISRVTNATVRRWIQSDDAVLLLRIARGTSLPASVQRYLDGPDGVQARTAYKCRTRQPWYVVPDVTVPTAFLSYMSGGDVSLVANGAGCVCTNSVHAVHLNGVMGLRAVLDRWHDPFTALSCEVEGHPLGGGMLKLEPGEAVRLVLAKRVASAQDDEAIATGLSAMKRWRHCGEAA